MNTTQIHHISDFNKLKSIIINTTSPTILAFTAPDTFGQYWLERMQRTLAASFTFELTFNIIKLQKIDELEILTREGRGPVIFFIKNRQIIGKSLGRVSEKDFMNQLNNICPIGQAA